MSDLPRYARHRTYDWNYEHAPDANAVQMDGQEPLIPGSWSFCGRPVASPLGVSAGPLLNGHWALYYAALGFDILTYKTVRSQTRACYPMPNLVPVDSNGPIAPQTPLQAKDEMGDSWAISFGMPSQPAERWQDDVAWTRQQLPPHKLLCVSVVATPGPDWSVERVAEDYARCARWAFDSGADAIEMNFSCPNVTSCDGQLYQQAQHAALVAQTVRARVPGVPLIVKIGHVDRKEEAEEIVDALEQHVDALSMVNCVATRVVCEAKELFGSEPRGIGGQAIYAQSLAQVHMFSECTRAADSKLELIGVGGISSATCVSEFLQAGAKTIQMATAPMLNPLIARQIKRELAR